MFRLTKENVERIAEGYSLIKEKKTSKAKEGGGNNGEGGVDKDA